MESNDELRLLAFDKLAMNVLIDQQVLLKQALLTIDKLAIMLAATDGGLLLAAKPERGEPN